MSEKGRGGTSSPNKIIANGHKLMHIYDNFAMKNSKTKEGGVYMPFGLFPKKPPYWCRETSLIIKSVEI